MQRLEHQYKRVVKNVLAGIVVVQSIVIFIWSSLIEWFGQLQIIQETDPLRNILSLVGFPSVAAFGYWRIRRFEKNGWRERNKEVDFTGEWYMVATISDALSDPLTNASCGDNVSDESVKKIIGMELHGIAHVSQTPTSLSVDNTAMKLFEQDGTYKLMGTLKSTSARLSERGQEIRMTYTVVRIRHHPPYVSLGDRGVIRLSVTEYENSVDSRPLKLAGTFSDTLGSGRILTIGSVDLFRRMTHLGSPREAEYYEIGKPFPSFSDKGNIDSGFLEVSKMKSATTNSLENEEAKY